jgi:hypothetical protein
VRPTKKSEHCGSMLVPRGGHGPRLARHERICQLGVAEVLEISTRDETKRRAMGDVHIPIAAVTRRVNSAQDRLKKGTGDR